jgi:hypothetical protein
MQCRILCAPLARDAQALRVLAVIPVLPFLVACASTQLNYNTLDLAASSQDLITSQIILNLVKFRESHYAIPSQVSIPSGSATTTNSITPTIGGPWNAQLSTTLANTVAAPLLFTTSHTHTSPNNTFGVTAGDQWSQNWTMIPLEDPDQLRRLRALYRFGAGITNERQLACEYPLVQRAVVSTSTSTSGTTSTSTAQTVNVYVSGTKVKSESLQSPAVAEPDNSKNSDSGSASGHGSVAEPNVQITKPPAKSTSSSTKSVDNYILPGCDHGAGTPDPAFLRYPGCIICQSGTNKELAANELLSNKWLWNPVDSLPPDAIPLGRQLYLIPQYESKKCRGLSPLECSQKEYSDFVLFILEATLQSTSSSAGTSGKGTPQKGGAPALVQTPAAPQIQLQ